MALTRFKDDHGNYGLRNNNYGIGEGKREILFNKSLMKKKINDGVWVETTSEERMDFINNHQGKYV